MSLVEPPQTDVRLIAIRLISGACQTGREFVAAPTALSSAVGSDEASPDVLSFVIVVKPRIIRAKIQLNMA
jgi:hypothetical protein